MNRKAQRGFSLIEIMVSLIIGLVVIGAVFSNYLSSVTGQRSGAAVGQMAEDAALAFSLMRRQVAMAGYSRPTGFGAGAGSRNLVRSYTGPFIFGCDGVFANPSIGRIESLSCGAAGNSAIGVAFEADASTSIVDGVAPRDANGAALKLGANPPYLSEARFYLAGSTLMSKANGGGAGTAPPTAASTLPDDAQAVVENIQAMTIQYGQAGAGLDDPNRYVSAATISNSPSDARWRDVKSVRVCLVVRSEAEILDEITPYYGCNAVLNDAAPSTTTPADKRLYRAFVSTIMLQN